MTTAHTHGESPAAKQLTEAYADLEHERAVLAQWQGRREDALASRVTLQTRTGDALLAAPDSAAQLGAEMTRLQIDIEMAERAIAAQTPRITEAATRYLLAELATAKIDADRDRQALAAHESQTAKLLAQLEAHEGSFVPLSQLNKQLNDLFEPWQQKLPLPKLKSQPLRWRLMVSLRRVEVLEELVAGRDPKPLIRSWSDPMHIDHTRYLPKCVEGEAPVVPLQAYIDARAG